MKSVHARQVITRMVGYWPSPAIDDAEAVAWAEELTSPEHEITPTEALAFLRRRAYAGDVYRPRPGELVSFVRDERRAQARLVSASKMLAAGRAGAVSGDRARQWVRACRRTLAGEPLEDAKRAEGLVSA